MLGISIWSNNATRLILCAGLWHVLDITTNEEEMEMEKKFGMEYSNYRTKVKTKFIPERVVNALPLFKWYLTLHDKTIVQKLKEISKPCKVLYIYMK